MYNNFDEAVRFNNGNIHVKFFTDTIEQVKNDHFGVTDFIMFSNVVENVDLYAISEYWENVGNSECCYRFYSAYNGKIYTLFSSQLNDLMNGKKIILKPAAPDYDTYEELIKLGFIDTNPITRFEIREIEGWHDGEGWYYNNSYFVGYLDTKAENIKKAFVHYLNKEGIYFKKNKTLIIDNIDNLEIVSKKDFEPLYTAIPVNY